MAIFRGAGGSGDATTDSNTQALAAINAALEAEASKNAAAASASAAAASATSASDSASTATTQASLATSNGAAQVALARTQANLATTNGAAQVALATTQAGNAATSATNSATSASTATTQAGIATTKASEAATSATNASSSASTASTQATNAASSASTATTQAGIATTQASNASSSASAAATSAANAATIYDNFDDRYLGQKSSNPTVDNDGNTLITGALYFNTTLPEMRVWSGTAWNFIGASGSAGVNSFNTRFGDVTLTSSDVTTALTYTPLAPSAIGTTVQAYDADLTAFAAKTAPTGNVVGTTDTQTLTNKALNGTLGATTPSTAVVTSLTNSGLISGRVTFASTGGLLADSANLVFNGTNLGVGTASPTSRLHIQIPTTASASNTPFFVTDGATSSFGVKLFNNVTTIFTGGGGEQLTFEVDGSERMRIDSAGNVLLSGISTARAVAGITPLLQLESQTTNVQNSSISLISNSGTANTNASVLSFGRAASSTIGSVVAGSANLSIGKISFAAGDGTGLIASSLIEAQQDAAASTGIVPGRILFSTANSSGTMTERMRIDSAGNLGLGVTPQSWYAGTWAIELGNRYASIYSGSGQSSSPHIIMATNSYSKTATGLDTYIATGYASKYIQSNANHIWYNAPSGTAGTSITFTQAMTLDASGVLGVGITPSAWTTGNSLKAIQFLRGSVFSNAGNDVYLTSNMYYNGTNDIYIATDVAASLAIESGAYRFRNVASGTAGTAITWTTPVSITAAGELLVGTTTAVSGGANLQVSDGITFPATQVASANANTLDDYEEGTFTPTISGSTTAGTGTYTTQTGRYTKVGRSVFITVAVVWTAHTGTGNIRISGLPFTSVNIASYECLTVPEFINMTMPASTIPCAIQPANSALINLYSQAVGSGFVSLLAMDTAASIYFSITYEAA